MSDNGQQVPLIERLRSVPAAARVLEHTPNPLGYDTASIPVGALCREAAARIAELEGRLASILDASEDDMSLPRAEGLAALWTAGKLIGGDAHAAAVALYAALAAERERRAAAEKVLSWLDMRGGLGYEKHGRIADHFARYEKEPT